MNLVSAIKDAAAGLPVTAVFLIRYGVLFPGSCLRRLIARRVCPLGRVREFHPEDARPRPPARHGCGVARR